MRRVLQGRAGMGLAFLLGLVIATAGTATAAKLITGKQIKDGSISSKDLSKAVQAQLEKAGLPGSQGAQGVPGAQGPKGDAGVPGPVSGDLPSGVTLRGNYAVLTNGAASNAYQPISFGLRLATEPTVHVVPLGGPKPGECPGTLYMPEAAPGHLCVYRGSENGISGVTVGRLSSAATPDDPTSAFVKSGRNGALLFFSETGSGVHVTDGAWAVTAP